MSRARTNWSRSAANTACASWGPTSTASTTRPRISVRDLLHRLRRQGQRRAVVAVGRHRHGHHRLLALGQDGRLGDRRARQQVGHRRGRSAHLLRAGRQHAHHRAALRGPEGRPRLRRSGEARLEEEAHRGPQGGPHQHGRAGGQFAHRRARRQRQDLRGRVQAVRRDPRALAARPARFCARHPGAADAEGQQRRHHHRRRRFRRAAVRCLRRQWPVADGDAARSRCRVPQIHSAVRCRRQSGRHHRRRAADAPIRTRCGSDSRIRASMR